MSEITLEEVLKERLHTKELKRIDGSVSGGCISKCMSYTIDNDVKIFVKTNSSLVGPTMFRGEYESLKQILATQTIRVPKPMLVLNDFGKQNNSAIVMEYLNIDSIDEFGGSKLGKRLANLHDYNNKVIRYNKRASKWIGGKIPSVKQIVAQKEKGKSRNEEEPLDEEAEAEDEDGVQLSKHCLKIQTLIGSTNKTPKNEDEPTTSNQYPDRFIPQTNTEQIVKFGFDVPTSCGSIPQVNEWTDDWVSFYARHRIDKAIRELLSDHGDRELSQQWSYLQLKINKLFSDLDTRGENKIIPALLHGDLWSGNVAQLSDNEPVIYDPSSFYGHSEYEFGIARMFGGLPKSFEDAYFELMPKKKLFERRNKLYQLFHHLNHWSHFGSGYRGSSLRIIKDLNALV